MTILHLSAECYPVAKTGGLGDVVGALPKYLINEGLKAVVALPFYDRKFTREHTFETVYSGSATLGHRVFDFEVLKEATDVLGFELYLIKIPGLLDREEIYCYPDETEQFVAYQIAVLEWIVKSGFKVDVFHCHDHHAGLVPFLMQHSYKFNSLANTPSVLTIHNGQYQGWMGWDKLYYLPDIDNSKTGLLDWNGCINPLAAAVKCCWRYTTVSPSYLEELRYNSNGLEFLFEIEKGKGSGIINGIDPDVWNPAKDEMIIKNYTKTTLKKGKEENKKWLCKTFNLSENKPLITFIGRLVVEKGADLLSGAFISCLENFEGEANYLILGSGDKIVEQQLEDIKVNYSNNYNTFIGYDEQLSHRIYAGADFILMPSRVEPCGLNQLYSLKYGTVPVVRNTGGLKDTVVDLEIPNGYGIKFAESTEQDIINAVERAINLFKNKSQLDKVKKYMFGLDYSWHKSANLYNQLYSSLNQQKDGI